MWNPFLIGYNPRMPLLKTSRLTLRQLTLDDAPFILELLNDPSFLRFIGDRGVRNLDDARKYLQNGPLESYTRNGFGLYLTQLKDGDIPIGMCGLIKREGLDAPDIGYAFLPPYWGKGYATEAADAVMAYGRTRLGLDRIVAITTPDNDASIRVLEKISLRFEKMITLPNIGGMSKLFTPFPPVE